VQIGQQMTALHLTSLIDDILEALVAVDISRVPFKTFQPGVGPYGEPQLLKLVAQHLNRLPRYGGQVAIRRSPDLLIPGQWMVEFKIARPFGDNGEEAENWAVNLLHPYRGNVSSVGDCLKLLDLEGIERRAVVVIGYEHEPAKISLDPLIASFETVVREVVHISLSPRIERIQRGLVHPVHQVIRVFAWEVLGSVHALT
jgi:hypothetical protein